MPQDRRGARAHRQLLQSRQRAQQTRPGYLQSQCALTAERNCGPFLIERHVTRSHSPIGCARAIAYSARRATLRSRKEMTSDKFAMLKLSIVCAMGLGASAIVPAAAAAGGGAYRAEATLATPV